MSFKQIPGHQNEAGFTIMEIVIVFAIIGLLSSYMLGTSFIATRQRARDTDRKKNLTSVALALEQYFNDYGNYPPANSGQIYGCGTGTSVCAWGDAFENDNGVIYMGELPSESLSDREYVYRTNAVGNAYQLYVRLEAEDDPDLDQDGDGTPDEYSFVTCGTIGNCNYGISSGNTTPETNPL